MANTLYTAVMHSNYPTMDEDEGGSAYGDYYVPVLKNNAEIQRERVQRKWDREQNA